MDHHRLSQHKKNQQTEFLVKWEKNAEVLWEKDIDLWQFNDQVQEYITSILTRSQTLLEGVVC
jgi:hypothetical protein